ncbi:39S ribosomal protein L30, mitochondrial [Megalops cyprinoides]|uniref:39S ribosomal protein L30, mitochondrial n=1 Tax=Megalops cyprinoides TaxID=118141 RepID=UPI0018645197|nr:39S ribosomal protein L30, mitochondrial [Megalops cyprinoides]
MAGFCCALRKTSSAIKNLTEATQLPWNILLRSKFTKPCIPDRLFEEWSKHHEKYGGDPEQPHKLHLITRVKTTLRRPYWEKKIVHDLGLDKPHQPRVHKNIPTVNDKLKMIKHLVKIQPLKLPHGLPSEEDMANTILKSNGELVIRKRLKPLEPKAIES